MTNEKIQDLLQIQESYEMPNRLMDILDDKESREKLFDEFLKFETDLSYDWFTEYFQTEHGDRDKLKQDFTPVGISEIVSRLGGHPNVVHDICSGTGGLVIKEWSQNKGAFFHCEEVSSRTVPILLFNMAIRGMTGELVHGDSLEQRIDCVYKLTNNGKYSDIEKVSTSESHAARKIISNPPYSLSWNLQDKEEDARFKDYGLAPKSKADYAFILHALYQLSDGGTMLAILPHGVLFRSSQEGKIRQQLIEKNMIDGVIGLPDNMFLNTSIPTLVFVLKNGKQDNSIFFIDASKECIKNGKLNIMTDSNIDRVVNTYRQRENVDKFSYLASMEEIKENGYNLNIPRYVDTFEPEEVPDLMQTIQELDAINQEIKRTEYSVLEQMKQMVGTTPQADTVHKVDTFLFEQMLASKYGKSLQKKKKQA